MISHQSESNDKVETSTDFYENEEKFSYPHHPADPDRYFDNLNAKKKWREEENSKIEDEGEEFDKIDPETMKMMQSFKITSKSFEEPFAPQLKGKLPKKVIEKMKENEEKRVEISIENLEEILKQYNDESFEWSIDSVSKKFSLPHQSIQNLTKYLNIVNTDNGKVYWKTRRGR